MNVKIDAPQAIVVEIDTQDEEAAACIADAIRAFLELATFNTTVRTFYDEDGEGEGYDADDEVGC